MRRAAFALFLAAAASPALAEGFGTGSAPGIPWLRLFFSLLFCLALAWGAILLLRRYQRRGAISPFKDLLTREGHAPRRIVVIETRRASIHADLCLVECDGETYFLALSAGRATVLERGAPPETAS